MNFRDNSCTLEKSESFLKTESNSSQKIRPVNFTVR
ncbi:hypothetical protein WP1_087 [Pseudomonas phage WP1]